MILAGDIGVGNSVLALFKKAENENSLPSLVAEQTYASKEFKDLEAMINAFFQQHTPPADDPVNAACLGISGPVADGKGQIIGLPWQPIKESSLCELLIRLSWKKNNLDCCKEIAKKFPVQLVNSLGAVDLNNLESKEKLENINAKAVSRTDNANRAWIAARSGLGEAILSWDNQNKGLKVTATEGGNSSFAPRNAEEMALLSYLLKKCQLPVVSYNQILSETGLKNIYDFLKDSGNYGKESAEVNKRLAQEKPADVIIELGMAKKDALCAKALDLFITLFGAEAGNLALKYYALGGIYLEGSIVPKIVPKLLGEGGFMKAFLEREKDDMIKLLSAIPIKAVMNPKVRLYGAAQRALDVEAMGKFNYTRCN
jgi:glucokinase